MSGMGFKIFDTTLLKNKSVCFTLSTYYCIGSVMWRHCYEMKILFHQSTSRSMLLFFSYLYSQSHSIRQVFVSLDRHDVLLWHRHGGPVPGARPGSDQPQRHQKRRRRTLPQIPHGNTINDSIKPPTRRRRQGRFHQMALHDITHLGRISHRKMDPWGKQALAASNFD